MVAEKKSKLLIGCCIFLINDMRLFEKNCVGLVQNDQYYTMLRVSKNCFNPTTGIKAIIQRDEYRYDRVMTQGPT